MSSLDRAASKAEGLAAARSRIARALDSSRADVESAVRDLLSFSAAVDQKALEELDEKGKVDKRELTNMELSRSNALTTRVKDLIKEAEKLSRAAKEEIDNAKDALTDLPDREAREIRGSLDGLKKLADEADSLSSRARVVERALSRARKRDDLSTVLMKGAGVGAILALAATVAGLSVAGGVIAVPALLAFGAARAIEEAKKL